MTMTRSVVTDAVWTLCGQVDDNQPVRMIPVHTFPFRIGRQPDLSLSVECATVSKVHAELVVDDDQLVVRDLNSTNGTFVNGRRVTGSHVLLEGDILQVASLVFRIVQQEPTLGSETLQAADCEQAMALVRFDRLISDRAVVPFFQPIVRPTDQTVVGYEVLGRSEIYGLKTPKVMFQAASQLNLQIELSRLFRCVGLEAGVQLPGTHNFFLNSHPSEMEDIEGLIESLRQVRHDYPSSDITLEIHEATITDPRYMLRLRTTLDDLAIRMAYDDFGAGQSRLLELVEVPPDYLKFDIAMIKNIDMGTIARHHVLRSLVKMVRDLGIAPLAEGVETAGEAEVCIELGFELVQGFHFGEPAPVDVFC